NQLRQAAQQVLKGPNALTDANLDATLAALRAAVSSSLTLTHAKPRWTKDPFPLKSTSATAPTKPLGGGSGYGGGVPAPSDAVAAAPATASGSTARTVPRPL